MESLQAQLNPTPLVFLFFLTRACLEMGLLRC